MCNQRSIPSRCLWSLGIAITFCVSLLSMASGGKDRWSVALDQSAFMLTSNSATPVLLLINNPHAGERLVTIQLVFANAQGISNLWWAMGISVPPGTSRQIFYIDTIMIEDVTLLSSVAISLVNNNSERKLASLKVPVDVDFDSTISADQTSGTIPGEVKFW